MRLNQDTVDGGSRGRSAEVRWMVEYLCSFFLLSDVVML
jgi:hypothetical protein